MSTNLNRLFPNSSSGPDSASDPTNDANGTAAASRPDAIVVAVPRAGARTTRGPDPPRPRPRLRPIVPLVRPRAAMLSLALVSLLAFVPVVQAQDEDCSVKGRNMQCTEFGTIAMDDQRDIRGDPIDLAAEFTLDTAYADQGARWLLVSVRNVAVGGLNPVTIDLQGFASPHGDIVTTRVEQPSPSEINLWVDTLDMPVGTPVVVDLRVGATERGAYKLETLVMAFDRGYAPMQDADGEDVSLFSYTLLGVNKETANVASDDEGLLERRGLPGLGALPLLGALAAAVVLARRWSA